MAGLLSPKYMLVNQSMLDVFRRIAKEREEFDLIFSRAWLRRVFRGLK